MLNNCEKRYFWGLHMGMEDVREGCVTFFDRTLHWLRGW